MTVRSVSLTVIPQMASIAPSLLERCYQQVQHHGQSCWECRFCSRQWRPAILCSVRESSGNAWKHIRAKHPSQLPSEMAAPTTDTSASSDIASIASPPASRSKRPISPSAESSVQKKSKQSTLFAAPMSAQGLARQMVIAFAINHLPFQLDETVQASMFIAFNDRLLNQSERPLPSFKEVELSLDYAEPVTDDENESEEVSSESDEDADDSEDVEMEAVGEMEEEKGEEAAAPVRQATELFLRDFIRENGIHAKTRFGPDLTAKLDEAARLHNEGGGAMDTLIRQIRKIAKQ
jgi:hypothetical protein